MNYNQIPEGLMTPGEQYQFPTLYARDNKDKFKIWNLRVVGVVGGAQIVAEWGQLGGKQQSKITVIDQGKNLGRSNETTPQEQAYAEAQAMWVKKKERDGYYGLADLNAVKADVGYMCDETHYYELHKLLRAKLPKAGITVEDFVKPMLAQKFWKETSKGSIPAISFPCLVQPKLNGVRCTVDYAGGEIKIMSREGTRYNVAHLLHYFACFYHDYPEHQSLVFDGELYIPGTFVAEIAGAAKSPNLLTGNLQYHIFDIVLFETAQLKRLEILKNLQNKFSGPLSNFIQIVPTRKCMTDDLADYYRDKFIEEGYEGAIFRHPGGYYEPGKRSKYLVKYKRTESAEFRILGVIDSPKDPELAIFVCRNDVNHETFEVIPVGGDDLRRKYYREQEKLLGKMLTVEYYERTKPSNLPFHAKGIAVRDYE